MPKKKTEDRLKETISAQRGEIARLKREKEALQDSVDERSLLAHENELRYQRTARRASHLLDCQNHCTAEHHFQAGHDNLFSMALSNLESQELEALYTLQAKRRVLADLGEHITLSPLIISGIPVPPKSHQLSTPSRQDTAKNNNENNKASNP